jgi:hypothetical protein
MTLAPGVRLGIYESIAPLGHGGAPLFGWPTVPSSGEVSSAFAAKRLLRDHAEARGALKPSAGEPRPG